MSAIRLARGATRRDRILEVRRLLPRPCRLAARRGRLRPRDARRPCDCGRAGRARRTRSSRRTTTSTPPLGGRALRRGLACVIVEPVAGNMGVVPPAPGFLEALRELCDASALARLRRGDHRLPDRARRRAGAVRGPRRPDGAREDRRRRAPDRRVRRLGRRDEAPRAGRGRLPGGHALGQPARHRCGTGCHTSPARSGRLRGARTAKRRASKPVYEGWPSSNESARWAPSS